LLFVEEKPSPITLSKGEPGMKSIPTLRAIQYSICILLILQVYSACGAEEDKFPPGTQIPQFTVGASDSPEVQKYLGLKNNGPFKLSEIGAKVVLIDFTNST
jgi:hypothetical protein